MPDSQGCARKALSDQLCIGYKYLNFENTDDVQLKFLYQSDLRISTVVNRVFPSLHGGSFIITLTVPLTTLLFVEIRIRKKEQSL